MIEFFWDILYVLGIWALKLLDRVLVALLWVQRKVVK